MNLLQIAGILLAVYGANGILTSKVYAKSGMSARYVYRDEEPMSFWVVCSSYIGVGVLIFFAAENIG